MSRPNVAERLAIMVATVMSLALLAVSIVVASVPWLLTSLVCGFGVLIVWDEAERG